MVACGRRAEVRKMIDGIFSLRLGLAGWPGCQLADQTISEKRRIATLSMNTLTD